MTYTPRHARRKDPTVSKYAARTFWIDTMDRTIASTAQGFIASAALDTTGLLAVDWTGVLSVAGATGLLAFLTSIAFRGKDPETRQR